MSAPMDLIEMGLIEIDLPGPLPEAFLALSAAAIPDNPADLVARSAPSHWWFASGGRARAWVVPGRGRIAAFDHPDARTDGRNVGFFGWWESTGDATADEALFAAAEGFLGGLGRSEIAGPVEQTSLYGYRLLDQRSDPLGPMVGEPDNPLRMVEWLTARGFEPLHSYNTRLVPAEVLPALDAAIEPAASDARSRGFSARPLDADSIGAHLDEVVDVLLVSFGENFGFVPPPRELLERHVLDRLVPMMCPDLTTGVFDADDRLLGWMLVYPHYGPLCLAARGVDAVAASALRYEAHMGALRELLAPDLPWAACRTVAFAPEARGLGLTPLMVHTADRAVHGRYGGWLLAMSRLDNRTQDFYRPDPEGRRLYSVYSRSMEAAP